MKSKVSSRVFLGILVLFSTLVLTIWLLPPVISVNQDDAYKSGLIGKVEKAVDEQADVGLVLEIERIDASGTIGSSNDGERVFRVSLTGSSSGAIPHAAVAPWTNGSTLDSVLTDSSGKVSFLGLAGAGILVVNAPGFHEAYFEADFESGHAKLVLDESRSLSGKIHVSNPDGSGFRYPLKLFSVSWNKPAWLPRGLSEKMSAQIMVLPQDGEGGFSISGLPHDWEGRLSVPREYVLCNYDGPGELLETGRTIKNLASGDFLNLEVVVVPQLIGRVVTPGGDEGVEGVSLTILLDDDGGVFEQHRGATGLDGRFVIPVSPGSNEERKQMCEGFGPTPRFRANVEIFGNATWGGNEIPLFLESSGNLWDLGDLQMTPQEQLQIRVVDDRGSPILGARVDTGVLGNPTDDNGEVSVGVPENILEFTVRAVGFEDSRVSRPSSFDQVLEVVLFPVLRLRVILPASYQGDLATDILRLRSDTPILEMDQQVVTEPSLRIKRIQNGQNGRVRMDFQMISNQKVIDFWGLKPGISLEAQLVGTLGGVMGTSGRIILTLGGTNEIKLVIDNPKRTFHGDVVDGLGEPIVGAELWVSNADQGFWVASSANDGSFAIDGIVSSSIRVKITKEGYAPIYLEDYEVPLDSAPVRFSLLPGRDVLVHLRDFSGEAVTGASLILGWNHGGVFAKALGNGEYQLSGMPEDSFVLHWILEGAEGEALIPRGVREDVLILPEMVTLTLSVKRRVFISSLYYDVEVLQNPYVESLEGTRPARSFEMAAGTSEKRVSFQVQGSGPYFVRLSAWGHNGGVGIEILETVGPVDFQLGQHVEVEFNLER